GPSVRTISPLTATVASPSSITQKAAPPLPSSVAVWPSEKRRSAIRSASCSRSMPEKSGTRLRLSTTSAMDRVIVSATLPCAGASGRLGRGLLGLLAEQQRGLARGDEPVGAVRAEGGARFVEVERAEHLTVEEAVLAARAPLAPLAGSAPA